jgi:hypothetical protein
MCTSTWYETRVKTYRPAIYIVLLGVTGFVFEGLFTCGSEQQLGHV